MSQSHRTISLLPSIASGARRANARPDIVSRESIGTLPGVDHCVDPACRACGIVDKVVWRGGTFGHAVVVVE